MLVFYTFSHSLLFQIIYLLMKCQRTLLERIFSFLILNFFLRKFVFIKRELTVLFGQTLPAFVLFVGNHSFLIYFHINITLSNRSTKMPGRDEKEKDENTSLQKCSYVINAQYTGESDNSGKALLFSFSRNLLIFIIQRSNLSN